MAVVPLLVKHWGRTAYSWLLDRLVPPLGIQTNPGPAYFAYASHKSGMVDGRHVCPLVDPLVEHLPSREYTYVTLGQLEGAEEIASVHIPRKIKWGEFLFSQLFFFERDLADLRFLMRLYDAKELCLLMRPGRFHEYRLFRRIFALRNFLLARYFALKFRRVAVASDSAHVVVYYNAMMLGIVCAFRRLGKPVWDIQHGYIGPQHDAYNNTEAYVLDSNYKPTGFLVWERHFGEYLEAALGLPWQSTDYHHLRTHEFSGSEGYDGFTILYSLQWGTPVPDEVQVAVEHFAGAVNWVFRMHPAEPADRPDLEWVLGMKSAAIADTSQPLPVALRSCDLHVTYNSGVAHEAAMLGIPTLFLDPGFSRRAVKEISSGLAFFVDDDKLISAIDLFMGSGASKAAESMSVGQRGGIPDEPAGPYA